MSCWFWGSVLDSKKCFWILGSFFVSGRYFGLWEAFLDSGEVFFDSGTCFGFWEMFWTLKNVFGSWDALFSDKLQR